MRLSNFTGSMVILAIGWAIWPAYLHKNKPELPCHSIKLTIGHIREDGPVDIWDPPPTVKILHDGRLEILGETYPEGCLPKDMADWVILRPFDSRGISLAVHPEVPLQKVVDFLDQFKLVSDHVMNESRIRWGVTGKPAQVIQYYYSDTLRRYIPQTPPPPVILHTSPPPNPALNSYVVVAP